ncbi:hypothetical protein HBB16_00405 [Pseudonocardia sp. MCCB 268]|nr:hypothetical protein [Pseudonocardia cytotoxica]
MARCPANYRVPPPTPAPDRAAGPAYAGPVDDRLRSQALRLPRTGTSGGSVVFGLPVVVPADVGERPHVPCGDVGDVGDVGGDASSTPSRASLGGP